MHRGTEVRFSISFSTGSGYQSCISLESCNHWEFLATHEGLRTRAQWDEGIDDKNDWSAISRHCGSFYPKRALKRLYTDDNNECIVPYAGFCSSASSWLQWRPTRSFRLILVSLTAQSPVWIWSHMSWVSFLTFFNSWITPTGGAHNVRWRGSEACPSARQKWDGNQGLRHYQAGRWLLFSCAGRVNVLTTTLRLEFVAVPRLTRLQFFRSVPIGPALKKPYRSCIHVWSPSPLVECGIWIQVNSI
jgi:hypothetical protein